MIKKFLKLFPIIALAICIIDLISSDIEIKQLKRDNQILKSNNAWYKNHVDSLFHDNIRLKEELKKATPDTIEFEISIPEGYTFKRTK